MIFTLLKGAFQQLNATVFEENIFKQSNFVKNYKIILLKSIENNMQKFKSAGGFLPYAINHDNLEGNNSSSQQGVVVNVVPKKFCVICRFEDTEEKVLDHQAKFHFIDRLVCLLFFCPIIQPSFVYISPLFLTAWPSDLMNPQPIIVQSKKVASFLKFILTGLFTFELLLICLYFWCIVILFCFFLKACSRRS